MNYASIKRLFLLVVFATQLYAQSDIPTFPNPGKTPISKENQAALGMQVAEKIYQQMPVLPDSSPESQYVRQLGKKLAATIPEQYSWPFQFHVVPQKEINAFALPGGQMFVNVGTITAAKSEAELAGVMGHEMAHVYMQHSAKQAGKAQTTSMIAGIASGILGGTSIGSKAGGLVGQLGQMGIQMGAQGVMMKYSRNDESQADAVGAVILYKAGYNPRSMADFFQIMGAQGGKTPPEFFSSHPNPENRQEEIQNQIANWPAVNYVADSADFNNVRQHAATLRVYSGEEISRAARSGVWAALNQQNGATLHESNAGIFPTRTTAEALASPPPIALESVLPNQNMINANLGPMMINHPENWQVTLPEQKGQFVTIAPEKGITNRGVGYGVLLNGVPAPGGRINLDQINSMLIQKISDQTQLKQLSNAEPITVAGVEGRSTMLESPSIFPDANGGPQLERDWLVTVPRSDGSIIFMIFLAPTTHFDQFKPTFEAMLKSSQFK
jgi:Zn-dependent protease with chaperone function